VYIRVILRPTITLARGGGTRFELPAIVLASSDLAVGGRATFAALSLVRRALSTLRPSLATCSLLATGQSS
jgi:hypothetical protein